MIAPFLAAALLYAAFWLGRLWERVESRKRMREFNDVLVKRLDKVTGIERSRNVPNS